MLNLLYHVFVPVLAALALSGVEWLSAPTEDFRVRAARVGQDLCVLAAGLAGAFVHNAPVEHAPLDGALLACSILGSIMASAVIIALRRGTATGWKAAASITLGGAALGLPAYHIVAMAH